MSAITWQGCDCLVRPLMTGTVAWRASSMQIGVIEDADHDRVDVARQHARGVGDRLAAAELHLGAGQHDRLAAEFAHRDVERNARARRGPVEDHRQRLAGERPRRRTCRGWPSSPRRRRGCRAVRARAGRAGRGNGGPAPLSLAHAAVAFCRGTERALPRPRQAASSRRTASASSSSLTISGGSRRDDVVAGGNREQLVRRAPTRRSRAAGFSA